MTFETGKIMEFENKPIRLTLEDATRPEIKYVLTVGPSSYGCMMNVSHGKNRYCASISQAKQHILDALEIAILSQYAPTHILRLEIPLYPNIIIPLSDLSKMMPVLLRALENYF